MTFLPSFDSVKSIAFKLGLSLQIFKTALAAAISWWLATTIFQTHYPFFASLAAILTVQVTVADSLQKASQRIIGIVLGVIISMLMSRWLDLSYLSIFVVIFAGMTIFNAFKMNTQIISQVGISSFLVLVFGDGNNYAWERIIETLLGSAIAVIINALIVPQNAIPDIQEKLLKLSYLAATTLKSFIPIFEADKIHKKTGKSEVQMLLDQKEKTLQDLKIAQQSLKYTPFLSKTRRRLNELEIQLVKLEYMTVQIRGIRRGLVDLFRLPAFREEFLMSAILHRTIDVTADCIAVFGKVLVMEESINVLELKKIAAAQLQNECLLKLKEIEKPVILRDIGSILTDLNRILDETEV